MQQVRPNFGKDTVYFLCMILILHQYTLGFPKYVLSVTQFMFIISILSYTFTLSVSKTISVITESPDTCCHTAHLHYLCTSIVIRQCSLKADISNNPSFRLKHPGVPDGSDGSGGTSYPLTENQTRPVAQATCRVAYLPCGGYYTMPLILATRRVVYYARRSSVRLPLLCVRNVVTYTHHRNDTYVTLFAGVAVRQ